MTALVHGVPGLLTLFWQTLVTIRVWMKKRALKHKRRVKEVKLHAEFLLLKTLSSRRRKLWGRAATPSVHVVFKKLGHTHPAAVWYSRWPWQTKSYVTTCFLSSSSIHCFSNPKYLQGNELKMTFTTFLIHSPPLSSLWKEAGFERLCDQNKNRLLTDKQTPSKRLGSQREQSFSNNRTKVLWIMRWRTSVRELSGSDL